MKKRLLSMIFLCFALVSLPARADVLVLVHGYLGNGLSWEFSGVTGVLQRHGWQPAGHYVAGPVGVAGQRGQGATAENKYYLVDLPSEAPVLVQVHLLHEMLNAISVAHPDEPVAIAGHSAGGVVARAALVRGDYPNVRSLITIASPHLGTHRAEQALDATDIPFPLSLVTDFLGGDSYDIAMRSRSLYVDLVRPRPGTLLYWLNGQAHPDIAYFSIVRGSPAGWGDYIVPAISQDMNNVPALAGGASLVSVPAGHGLNATDGAVIVNLLADL